MNLNLIDLEARQTELASEISSLRFRVFKQTATRAERGLLRKLENEFVRANVIIQRWRQRKAK